MSTIDRQLVCVETALKLKKKGVPQKSVFFWVEKDTDETSYQLVSASRAESYGEKAKIAAFSVAELGDFFPDDFNLSYKRVSRDSVNRCAVDCYDPKQNKTWKIYPRRTNEANARAHMLDYLIEMGVIHIYTEPVGKV